MTEQGRILEVIGSKFCIAVLLDVYSFPGLCISAYTEGNTNRTRMHRIQDLEEIGFITVDRASRQYNAYIVDITPLGVKWGATFAYMLQVVA